MKTIYLSLFVIIIQTQTFLDDQDFFKQKQLNFKEEPNNRLIVLQQQQNQDQNQVQNLQDNNIQFENYNGDQILQQIRPNQIVDIQKRQQYINQQQGLQPQQEQINPFQNLLLNQDKKNDKKEDKKDDKNDDKKDDDDIEDEQEKQDEKKDDKKDKPKGLTEDDEDLPDGQIKKDEDDQKKDEVIKKEFDRNVKMKKGPWQPQPFPPMPGSLIKYDNKPIHQFSTFQKVFKERNLNFQDIQYIYQFADLNNNQQVRDIEWLHFRDLFIKPFEECDQDSDFVLQKEEALVCFKKSKEIKGLKYKEDHWVKILYILDRVEHITFVDYLFIRRVAVAFANCATLGYIKINRLYCALSITSPRANKLFFPQEKEIFEIGKILYKGFIIEDDNGMDTVEFLGISRFFSYFDYGMLYVDGSIRKSDMQRTFMDGYLPNYFNFQIIDWLYEDTETQTFSAFASTLFSLKLFRNLTQNDVKMNYEQFLDLYEVPKLYPQLLKYIKKTDYPKRKIVQKASQCLWQMHNITANDYIFKYAGGLFFQKSQKLRFQVKSKKQDDEMENMLLEFQNDFSQKDYKNLQRFSNLQPLNYGYLPENQMPQNQIKTPNPFQNLPWLNNQDDKKDDKIGDKKDEKKDDKKDDQDMDDSPPPGSPGMPGGIPLAPGGVAAGPGGEFQDPMELPPNPMESEQKSLPLEDPEDPDDIEMDGPQIIFNQFDFYQNGSISMLDFLSFWKLGTLYCLYDTTFQQKLSISEINNNMQTIIKIGLNRNEMNTYQKISDFLQGNYTYSLNLKEFFAFYRLEKVFENLHKPDSLYSATLPMIQRGFFYLGIRLSKNVAEITTNNFDQKMREDTMNYQNAFMMTIQEDILTWRAPKKKKP